MSPADIENKIEKSELSMHNVPVSLVKKLYFVPTQIKLNQREVKRLIIWAAASLIILLGMNIFAWTSTFNVRQSVEFTSAYFDYLNTTP